VTAGGGGGGIRFNDEQQDGADRRDQRRRWRLKMMRCLCEVGRPRCDFLSSVD
jgi:hypothetical protein